MSDRADETVELAIAPLRQFAEEAMLAAGAIEEAALLVAEVQLEATLRGQPTHNVGSIPSYARSVKDGKVNSKPSLRTVSESDTHAVLDADDGPGQWAGVLAMRICMEKALASGMGAVGVRRSTHFGAAGYYASMAADRNLIGLCTTNGGLVLAPWGGATPTFGNNPLGVAIPVAGSHPIMLDIAMSTVAMGKVALSIAQGKGIPPDWYMDSEGRPTTDAKDYPQGLGVPMAGHKGYGLVLIMEILAGVLTGAAFGWDHEFRGQETPWIRDIGHFFLAIDPGRFMPVDQFKSGVAELISQIRRSKPAHGQRGAIVPGDPEYDARERNLAKGTVPLLKTTYEGLAKLKKEWGLKTELEPV